MLRKFLKWVNFNFRYLFDTPWDTGVSPPELYTFLRNSHAGRALDLGTGTGTNLITLAQAGWQAVGVDYSILAVMRARRKVRHTGEDAKVFLHDVTHLDFLNGTFDLILDVGCYHSLEFKERTRYRMNLMRLLKPGGTFLIYGFLSTENSRPVGISESEIGQFSEILQKVSEERGTERGKWGSVWLEFRKEKQVD